MSYFSQNITYLRKEKKKLSQEEASTALNENIKTLQAWEEGRAFPRVSKLTKICDLYDFFDVYSLLNTKINPSYNAFNPYAS